MASIAITQAQAAQMWATKAAVWEAGLGATTESATEI